MRIPQRSAVFAQFSCVDKASVTSDNRKVIPSPEAPPLPTLIATEFEGLQLYARGKVRDLYEVGENLLLVATDRISAFDHVLPTGIPGKGRVLTQLSLFWFDYLKDLVPNHLVTADVERYPALLKPYESELRSRSMLVHRARMFPAECVVRGYLSGSGWKDYVATGKVCGIPLPAGLRESERLPEPMFTPASKSMSGEHDENISFDQMVARLGGENAEELRRLSLAIYGEAAEHAQERGLILADTKFEFGRTAKGIVLADEVLTPDSSRFWPSEGFRPGAPQPSFDKQFVRDYLEAIGWNKLLPAPELPANVARQTQEKYEEALRLLSGPARGGTRVSGP
jgi:phosphoribosylaminoimidazole-succinocarboxamide synthase